MKSHINNVPMTNGEVSVVLSEMSANIVRHSCELARSVRDRGLNVLLINCATSDHRFRNVADTVIRHRSYKGRTNCRVRSVPHGDLVGEKDYIDTFSQSCRMAVLIICGWEWSSSSWRRKNDLIYYLRSLMARDDVAVVIYSQAHTKPTVGRYDRGGLGRMAELAIAIIRIETSAEHAEDAPPPPPLIVSPQEWDEADERTQLLINKINDLGAETERVEALQY